MLYPSDMTSFFSNCLQILDDYFIASVNWGISLTLSLKKNVSFSLYQDNITGSSDMSLIYLISMVESLKLTRKKYFYGNVFKRINA